MRTKKSAKAFETAKRYMPFGVNSNYRLLDPYPLYVHRAKGSRIWDVDGNEYIDFNMAFGALVAGHSHPILAKAMRERVANGTIYGFEGEDAAPLAAHMCKRFDIDRIKFSNTGLEGTLFSIRLARGVTGRTKIMKFEGCYHGSHDSLMVSIKPTPERQGDPRRPTAVPSSKGLLPELTKNTVIAPFNDLAATQALVRENADDLAGIILEPIPMNMGFILPKPGFLEGLRDAAEESGAVLIFDEVKTGVVIAYGGATEYFGIQPDLFCLAKSIGGGTPIGAFGGREEVMRVIEGGAKAPMLEAGVGHSSFGGTTRVAHMGTMNGSPLTMAAALAVLTKVLTPDVYPRLQAMGDRLTAGSQAIVDEFGLPGYAVNVGPKGIVMFTPQRVTNYRDFLGLDDELDRYLAVFREWAVEVTG